ncbi:myb family transcription factor PHL8-like isoform X3 [Ipomoea triloba]|uniref:myb family transcription factor PHL8-like isoform X3 n=1 Tax=Ipomoea triloba TaxID=35885 RepID=UPI00125DE733|nr:myb family transcription factor PHL8-like isoform X3 [Ipomoea triloba]
MAPQSVQGNAMSLVLSREAKPRLKWTAELHETFVDAVQQLGGADKATPKSLMKAMNIRGLSLYHLKSHLQKYRHGKSHQSQHSCHTRQQEKNLQSLPEDFTNSGLCGFRELQIAQALQVQMEVQKTIHEQIEVQRHLQLRIEAQGKYLQSALKKAQEILSKAEISLLISPNMVDLGCQSSSESGLTTEAGHPTLKDKENSEPMATLESCEREEETVENPSDKKRFRGRRYDDNETLKSSSGLLENLDLNVKSTVNKFDDTTDCKVIDLNREWV